MATSEIDPPPTTWPPELRDTWSRAVAVANSFASELDGVELPASDRMRAAGAAWWVALEHHSSIILLMHREKHASAFALLRPEIEAYLRGLWLSASATDAELTGFLSGDNAPGAEKLARRLEAEGIFDAGSLSSIQKQIWGAICDYTHTGSRQIIRHLTDSSIEPAHESDELVELLTAANAWALMSSVGVASAAQDEEKCQRLLEAAQFPARAEESTGDV